MSCKWRVREGDRTCWGNPNEDALRGSVVRFGTEKHNSELSVVDLDSGKRSLVMENLGIFETLVLAVRSATRLFQALCPAQAF